MQDRQSKAPRGGQIPTTHPSTPESVVRALMPTPSRTETEWDYLKVGKRHSRTSQA